MSNLPAVWREQPRDPPLEETGAKMEPLKNGFVLRDGRDYAALFGDVRDLVPGVGDVADIER